VPCENLESSYKQIVTYRLFLADKSEMITDEALLKIISKIYLQVNTTSFPTLEILV